MKTQLQLRFNYLVFILLLASSTVPHVAPSTYDIIEDDNGSVNNPTVSVVSSRPETTYTGKLGFRVASWGYFTRIQQQFKAGEEFCIYSPILGMRNLSCHVFLSKYWDTDTELIVSNSEGELIGSTGMTVVGKRSPYATVKFNDIPRPDIVQACVRNTGSAKTIHISMHLSTMDALQEFGKTLTNMTAIHNSSALALSRVEARLADILAQAKGEISYIIQDYFRLRAIARWVDGRGIAGSLAMLFCCFMSTALIRRWFGSPRSSV